MRCRVAVVVVELRVKRSDEFHPRLETARMRGECKSRSVRSPLQ